MNYFSYLTVRLRAKNVYKVIVNEGVARVNYRFIEIESEYLPEVFVKPERRGSEVCAKKIQGKYSPEQTEQTRLRRHYFIWLLVHFPLCL